MSRCSTAQSPTGDTGTAPGGSGNVAILDNSTPTGSGNTGTPETGSGNVTVLGGTSLPPAPPDRRRCPA